MTFTACIATEDRADRIVEVVVMVRPVDITRFDHQPEAVFLLQRELTRTS
jgi:hypothetical protein